ncbi:MAG: hypothetical protein AB7O57_08310 [Hyphomicrobiaceae bacterium]
MARKLEVVEPAEVSHGSNRPVFNPAEALADVDNVIALTDDAKEQSQPVKDEKSRLKTERGYNMKGFNVGIQMRRAERPEAVDMLRTIIACAEGMGLVEQGAIKMVPDLVDLMEAA